jgi:hypothetical protein
MKLESERLLKQALAFLLPAIMEQRRQTNIYLTITGMV